MHRKVECLFAWFVQLGGGYRLSMVEVEVLLYHCLKVLPCPFPKDASFICLVSLKSMPS